MTAMPQNKANKKPLSLSDLASLAEIIGTAAIVISLIFVGIQINQNTKATRAAAAQAVHQSFSEWYTSAQNDAELLGVSIDGMKDYDSLSETEKAQFIALFMAFNAHMQDAYYKWEDGSLSSELWRGWEFVSMNFLSTPGGKAFWGERSYLFGDSYRRYVEQDLMQRPPHPEAKPWGAFDLKETPTKQ